MVNEIEATGGKAVANGDDISTWAGAEALINTAVDVFGDLHAVVNNAGILRYRMLANMTEEEWDAVIKVHLKGTFGPSHFAAAYWRDQHKAGKPVDGRLINTTSVSGIYGTRVKQIMVQQKQVLHRSPLLRHSNLRATE